MEDRIRTWVADAEGAYERGSIESARAIYAYILKNFNSKVSAASLFLSIYLTQQYTY